MTKVAARAVALLGTAILLLAGCAEGGDKGDKQPSKARPAAAVEAELRAEVQALADLAGSIVTTWEVRTPRCDMANPGRSWAMLGSARIPLAASRHLEVLHAIRDRWGHARWQFGDDRIAPDTTLLDGQTGHLSARHPTADHGVTVISYSGWDFLLVRASSDCYQPAKGEDPASGYPSRPIAPPVDGPAD